MIVEIEPDGTGCIVSVTHELPAAWADFVEQAAGAWGRMLQEMEATDPR